MRASRPLRQVDRATTVRAVDDLDVLTQLGNLLLCERPDEVFLLEKFEKRRQTPVVVRAAEISEARVALEILCWPQPALALRTLDQLVVMWCGLADVFADGPKQRQR